MHHWAVLLCPTGDPTETEMRLYHYLPVYYFVFSPVLLSAWNSRWTCHAMAVFLY
jgi:hypothetical protein